MASILAMTTAVRHLAGDVEAGVAPWVWPEIRFRCPITVVPKFDPKKLSLMRKVLRVVPKGGYGVAVVVAHGKIGSAIRAGAAE